MVRAVISDGNCTVVYTLAGGDQGLPVVVGGGGGHLVGARGCDIDLVGGVSLELLLGLLVNVSVGQGTIELLLVIIEIGLDPRVSVHMDRGIVGDKEGY